MEWSVGDTRLLAKERENGDPAAQRGSSGSSPRKASGRSAMERTC
ncbi:MULTISPECIES: hypothetical protein [Priestia]|nr:MULTISPECIES: hypothetical protein [Priestia]